MTTHSLTVEQVNSFVNKEQILALDLEDLQRFTKADLPLLEAIKQRALSLLGSYDPLYKKIKRKCYWLENNDTLNANRRE